MEREDERKEADRKGELEGRKQEGRKGGGCVPGRGRK